MTRSGFSGTPLEQPLPHPRTASGIFPGSGIATSASSPSPSSSELLKIIGPCGTGSRCITGGSPLVGDAGPRPSVSQFDAMRASPSRAVSYVYHRANDALARCMLDGGDVPSVSRGFSSPYTCMIPTGGGAPRFNVAGPAALLFPGHAIEPPALPSVLLDALRGSGVSPLDGMAPEAATRTWFSSSIHVWVSSALAARR